MIAAPMPWTARAPIRDVGFALAAWLVDPHGNSLGLLQFKDEGSD
jgi:hypothetical protein